MQNNRFFCITLLAIIFSIGLVFHTVEADSISLFANNDVYYMGDYIVVFGTVDTVFEEMPVTIQIYYESTLIDVGQVPVATDGTFAATFTADGHQWKDEGTYSVRGFYTTTIIAETTFEFFTERIDKSSANFPINIPNS